jgi:hypothetical protein
VWYPHYVSWLLAILFELILLIITAIFGAPNGPFDFFTIALQSLRLCTFMTLLGLYMGLYNRKEVYNMDDTERQSLLKDVAGQQSIGAKTQSAGGYGATAGRSTKNGDTRDDVENDDWMKNKRKDRERIVKRLKQDGNWWTYAKGFAVSTLAVVSDPQDIPGTDIL